MEMSLKSDVLSEEPLLIVEDDHHIRQLLEELLQEEFTSPVVGIGNGLDAVAYLEKCKPRLVLLDIGLPGLDGIGVAARIHAKYDYQVPIVVLTACSDVETAAKEAGATAYLSKPFNLAELVSVLSPYLR